MKKNLSVLTLLFMIVLSANLYVSAQNGSLIVKPKKTTYKRTGADVEDYKKEFTVNYPQISGAASPAVKKKIEDTINYWKVFDTPLEENMSDNTWLESMDYSVEYNKNGIFEIILIMEGSGAYPDSSNRRFVINLKTGEKLKAADVFQNTPKLLTMVKRKFTAEVAQAKKEEPGMADMFGENKYTVENLDDFSVGDKGITFHYDYGFAHAFQAGQPDGTYFFTFAQLKPYIKKTGVFGQFIK